MTGPRIEVRLYRGWCWICTEYRAHAERGDKAPFTGYGWPTPGQAADAGRRHLQLDHWERT